MAIEVAFCSKLLMAHETQEIYLLSGHYPPQATLAKQAVDYPSMTCTSLSNILEVQLTLSQY